MTTPTSHLLDTIRLQAGVKPAHECLETYGNALFALGKLLKDGREDLYHLAIGESYRLNLDEQDRHEHDEIEPERTWAR